MIQDLEQIEYRRGMLDRGVKPENLPLKVWRGAKILADVRKAVNEENLLNLGGVYGDKRVGDPVEYDQPKIGSHQRHGRDYRLQPWYHAVHIG